MSNNSNFRGVFNKYYKNMPFVEMISKDINYAFLWLRNYFKNGFKSKSILVYPHYPSRGSTIYKMSNILNYNITNKLKQDTKFAIYWEYLTFREEYDFLEKLNQKMKILNLYSRDISKIYIDKKHQEVFGYSTIIDPLEYEGKIVRKNDINAKHDGTILNAPLKEKDEDYIYQILIDNTYSDELVTDIRVPVVGNILDFVYIKYRDVSERFLNTTVKTDLEKASDILSHNEIGLLNRYCNKLNLDYGELDVLRNKNDGKIYVVDVNNTPQGPPANTSSLDSKHALEKIGQALIELVNKDKIN